MHYLDQQNVGSPDIACNEIRLKLGDLAFLGSLSQYLQDLRTSHQSDADSHL